MNIFVFGTLLSENFRKIVLGRELHSEHICTASLKNFCVYWAEGGPFPVIVPQDGAEVHGIVLKDLNEHDIERLNYYELGFGYVLREALVETNDGLQDVFAYFCKSSDMASKNLWSFDDWHKKHSEIQ